MSHVFRSGVINAPAKEVWKVVREFNGLPGWNPPIAKSETEAKDGVEHRLLTFNEGATSYERDMGSDGMSTAYRIVGGDLPLDGYAASITVIDQGDSCLLCWSSSFTSENEGMEEVVGGVYQAGIDTIAERFG